MSKHHRISRKLMFCALYGGGIPSSNDEGHNVAVNGDRNEKLVIMALYRSPSDCNVVAIIVFEEGFHQPIKRARNARFSGCNGCLTYTCGLALLTFVLLT
ncbi:hypothetical protein TNCV_247831 [Trichonephila clavipes]|nr:hypothetical protein TNCV_247831 [Trichonephila clavipes]